MSLLMPSQKRAAVDWFTRKPAGEQQAPTIDLQKLARGLCAELNADEIAELARLLAAAASSEAEGQPKSNTIGSDSYASFRRRFPNVARIGIA